MKSNKGFTLVELLVTITIAAILASMAIPAMSKWSNEARLKSHANKIVYDLNEIRSNRKVTDYEVSDMGNITVTPTRTTISFSDDGKINARTVLTVQSSKVSTVYKIIIPTYGKISFRKQ